MAEYAKLRDKARKFEQRGDWQQALQSYESLVKDAPPEEVDVALWNRMGDLRMRLDETAGAVEAYERAMEGYSTAGLWNNAIALCKKILRVVPGRAPMYLRIGRLSAERGFLADARDYYLRYAERMMRAGQVDASFEALKEFADLSPGDAEVRTLLAEQLQGHGRESEAVEQLRILRAELVERGDARQAEDVGTRILSIDPGADASPLQGSPQAEAATVDDGLEFVDPDGAESLAAPLGNLADAEVGEKGKSLKLDPGPEDPPVGEAGGETTEIEGFETTSAATEFPDVDEGDVDALPLIELESELDPPRIPNVPDAPEEVAEPADEPERSGEYDFAIEPVAAHDAADDEVPVEPEHVRLGRAGRFGDAARAIRDELSGAAHDTRLYQKQVEYAFRSGETPVLEVAYMDLAHHLRGLGRSGEAKAVFERVLTLNPENAGARAALAPSDGGTDFIDLSALVLDEHRPRETTRFTVPEEEPTGDEERDFAEMLVRFKQKVSVHISAEDSTSHYDLGLAYKEMGLVDEAVAQFQVALRGGAMPLATLEILGQCFMEKKQYAVAARVLDRALQLPKVSETDLVGVLYLLACCEEALGRPDRAAEAYQRVLAIDIGFRDTEHRLRAVSER